MPSADKPRRKPASDAAEVERIAKLLYAASDRAYVKHSGCEPCLWVIESDECQERYRAMARAVIADTRRPT